MQVADFQNLLISGLSLRSLSNHVSLTDESMFCYKHENFSAYSEKS